MNTLRLTSLALRAGMLGGLLCISIPFTSYGEPVSSTSEAINSVQTESLSQQQESEAEVHVSRSIGFRSAESEEAHSIDHFVPQQRSLAQTAPELVETIDCEWRHDDSFEGKISMRAQGPRRIKGCGC